MTILPQEMGILGPISSRVSTIFEMSLCHTVVLSGIERAGNQITFRHAR